MELSLKKILESLNLEARSNPELNPKQTWESFVKDLLGKVNYDDLYVSFRRTIHTTDINPKNEYETPTGVYAYPIASYMPKVEMLASREKVFRNQFPYQSEQPYMVFMDVKDTSRLLSKGTPKAKLDEYVKKIDNLYGKIEPVHQLCELFIKNEYKSQYQPTPFHETHRFWLFLYSIAPYINKGGAKQTTITNICNAIGIDGFIDKAGDGYIHPAEKKQAVFFKVKPIANVYIYQRPADKNYRIVNTDDGKYYFYHKIDDYVTLMVDAETKKAIKKIPVVLGGSRFSHGFVRVTKPKSTLVNYMREDGSLLAKDFYYYMNTPSGAPTIIVSKDKYASVRNLMDMNGNLLLPSDSVHIIQRKNFYMVQVPNTNEKELKYDLYDLNGEKTLSNVRTIDLPPYSNMVRATLINQKQMLITDEGKPVTNETFEHIQISDVQHTPGWWHEYQYLFPVFERAKGHNLLTDNGKLLSPVWSKYEIIFRAVNFKPVATIQDPNTGLYNEIDDEGQLKHETWSENDSFDVNEQITRIKTIMGLNENTTIPGESVWNHIVSITPNENDIPWYFSKLIKPRQFVNVDNFNIESLLQSDPDFRSYYESNDERYSEWDDISPDDLYQEITVVDGELLDGYSRAATLLRKGTETTNAFVAV